MKLAKFLLCFSLAAIQLPLQAAVTREWTDLTTLEQKVHNYLLRKVKQQLPGDEEANITIKVRPIDRRLKLATCDGKLALENRIQGIQRRPSVKIRCEGTTPWSIFTVATVVIEKPVVVVKHGLPRHHILQAQDLTLVSKDISGLRNGYHSDTTMLLGKQLKRAVRAGDVAYDHRVQLPDIVRKGDLVTIYSTSGSLTVSSTGIAMADGSKGEKIRVENQRSSRILQARITGPGSVEVIL